MPEASEIAKTAAVVAVPLVQKAFEQVRENWAGYSDDDINQLQQITKYYIDHCAHCELGMDVSFSRIGDSPTAPTDRDSPLTYQTQLQNKTVPQYFQLQQKNRRLPVLYDSTIRKIRYTICNDANEWIRRMGTDHLSSAIEEVLGYLCEYQRLRETKSKLYQERRFSYDPINLFLEELKAWFLQLSHAPLA